MMSDALLDILGAVRREAVIMLIFYALAFGMILADLFAGVRKAKRAGDYISSRALRRTVDKTCKYFNMMLIFTLVDMVLIVSIQHYNAVASASWPVFPLFTLVATLLVAIMEGRSIFEALDRKTRGAAKDAAKLAAYLAANADALDKVVEALGGKDKRGGGDGEVL